MKYVIVLGAAQYDGRPSRILAGRVRYAAEHAAAHNLPIITVGGNLPGDRFTEAGVAKRLLENTTLDVTALEEGLIPAAHSRPRATSSASPKLSSSPIHSTACAPSSSPAKRGYAPRFWERPTIRPRGSPFRGGATSRTRPVG